VAVGEPGGHPQVLIASPGRPEAPDVATPISWRDAAPDATPVGELLSRGERTRLLVVAAVQLGVGWTVADVDTDGERGRHAIGAGLHGSAPRTHTDAVGNHLPQRLPAD
jgi:hypothetical protein